MFFFRLNIICIKIGLLMLVLGMIINGEVISGYYRFFFFVCY